MIDSICQRWSVPPSVVLAQDAAVMGEILWYLSLKAEYEGSASRGAEPEPDPEAAMMQAIPMEHFG